MDSLESSENFTIQDSPIFSNTINLSPAHPFNVPPSTQSLIGLNSPHQLVMSPTPYQTTSLVRTNFSEPNGATISAQDEGCNYCLPFVSGSGNDRTEHFSADPDKFLANTLNMDFLDPNDSSNLAIKQSDHIDQQPVGDAGKEIVLKLGHRYNTRVKEETETFAHHAFINQDPGDSMTEAFQHHGMHRSYVQLEDDQNELKTNWHSQIHVDGEVARSLALTRQQDAFNTIQSISYPERYCHPTSTMGITGHSSSGLQKLETDWHPQIHLDGEGERSLSLARKQTPSNTIQPISYPKQYLNPTPTMSIIKPSSSGAHLNNLFNSGATFNVKSAQMGSSSMQGRKSKPFFKSLVREFKVLLSAHLMKSSNISIVFNPIKDHSTQGDKNKRNAENVGDEEEFYRSSPKKERKRISESNHGDSSTIKCQCKKIKCVKRYCDCFAAGSYCVETCSCQGCLNVKKYDDEVLEAREKIESRHPLAFAPRVVQHSIKPSASGHGDDGTRLTPSFERHIRGCNCKKSMCLKKYCQCYQSKVGCSDGCHCEGCQNVYGQKGGIMKDPLSEDKHDQRTDSSFIDMVAPRNDSHGTDLGADQNSTPQSPPFLYCNQEDDMPNFWSSLEEYLPLPDFNNDSVSETAKRTLDQLSFHQEPDLGNAETGYEFTFPIAHQKPEETGTTSGLPNYRGWTNSSAPRFPSGTSDYSLTSSQNWSRSPVSPIVDVRGTKPDELVDFERELLNVSEDNRPETLEDHPMSLNVVKVSYQNKKRVSLPHDPIQEFGSSSPVGSLKSAPSYPVQQTKDPQDRGGNK